MAANGKVKIESGVKAPRSGRRTQWPFDEMKIGESFLVSGEQVNSLRAAASHRKQITEGKFNYTLHNTADGYRFWRIA